MLFFQIISVILIVILFVSTTYYYRRTLFHIEKFGKNVYLSKEDTSEFLAKDDDTYIESLSPADLYARKVSSVKEYKEKSVKNVLEFDENSKNILDKATILADTYFNKLNNAYIDTARINKIVWKFALTSNEENLPHTRSDIIFLSPYVLKNKEKALVSILIHEKVHIYQKMYIEEFQNMLLQNGYKQVKKRKEYPLIRANPDLDEFVYSDKNGKLMLTLYKNNRPKGITDVETNNHHHEHPFEEIAYKIGDNYM